MCAPPLIPNLIGVPEVELGGEEQAQHLDVQEVPPDGIVFCDGVFKSDLALEPRLVQFLVRVQVQVQVQVRDSISIELQALHHLGIRVT